VRAHSIFDASFIIAAFIAVNKITPVVSPHFLNLQPSQAMLGNALRGFPDAKWPARNFNCTSYVLLPSLSD
jgi:hypothetical protein